MRSCRRNARVARISFRTDNKPKQKGLGDQRFTRGDRLLDADSFQRVFKKPKRSRDTLFTVLSRENRKKGARLGLAISKKKCRLAVQRNRLKRVIRESFRSHKDDLSGLDVIVMCQAAASRASNKNLFDSLAAHWRRSHEAGTGRELDG